jgi:hypothetical protein
MVRRMLLKSSAISILSPALSDSLCPCPMRFSSMAEYESSLFDIRCFAEKKIDEWSDGVSLFFFRKMSYRFGKGTDGNVPF